MVLSILAAAFLAARYTRDETIVEKFKGARSELVWYIYIPLMHDRWRRSKLHVLVAGNQEQYPAIVEEDGQRLLGMFFRVFFAEPERKEVQDVPFLAVLMFSPPPNSS